VGGDEGGMDACGENAGGTAGENDPVSLRSRPWEGEQAKERLLVEAIIHLRWTYGVERESEKDSEKERGGERVGGG